MFSIYEEADGVLVLDSWIQELERSESIAEKAARLILCTWARRLWTMQEAVLAQNLFIQFKDGPDTLLNLKTGSLQAKPREKRGPFGFTLAVFFPIDSIHYYPTIHPVNLSLMERFAFISLYYEDSKSRVRDQTFY
jgi:hypothetical protein